MTTTVLAEIVSRIVARQNCLKSGNDEWYARHGAVLGELVRNYLPSGSGVDNGTTLDEDASSETKLVLTCSFHHMNDGGYYDGWTEHKIVVTPNLLSGFTIAISGRDRNEIKEYLRDIYAECLRADIELSGQPEPYAESIKHANSTLTN